MDFKFNITYSKELGEIYNNYSKSKIKFKKKVLFDEFISLNNDYLVKEFNSRFEKYGIELIYF